MAIDIGKKIDIEKLGKLCRYPDQDFVFLIEEALDAEERCSGMGIAFLHGMLCMAKMCREMSPSHFTVESKETTDEK